MAKRKKTIQLEHIPSILEKVVTVIDREVEALSTKTTLTDAETKTIIAYAQTLGAIYKDYRQEVIETKKELKSMSKEELQALMKAESN